MQIFEKSIQNVLDYIPFELRKEPLYKKVAELTQWIVEEFHDKDISKVRNFWNVGDQNFDPSTVLRHLSGDIYNKLVFEETSRTTLAHLIARLYNLKGTYKGIKLLLGLLDLDGEIYEWWRVNKEIEQQTGDWERWVDDPSVGEDGMDPCTLIVDLGIGSWVLDETLDERLSVLIQTFLWTCVNIVEIRWRKLISDQIEHSTEFENQLETGTLDQYNALRSYCTEVPIVGIGWDSVIHVPDCPIVNEFTVTSASDQSVKLVQHEDHYYVEELPLSYGIDPNWVWYVGEGGYTIPGAVDSFVLNVNEFTVGEGIETLVGLEWSIQLEPDVWVPPSPGIKYVGDCPGFHGLSVAGSLLGSFELHEVESDYSIINDFIVSPDRLISDNYIVYDLPVQSGLNVTKEVSWEQFVVEVLDDTTKLIETSWVNDAPTDLSYNVDWSLFDVGDINPVRELNVGDTYNPPLINEFIVGESIEDYSILSRHYGRLNNDGSYYYLNWLEAPLQTNDLSESWIINPLTIDKFYVTAHAVGQFNVGAFIVGDADNQVIDCASNYISDYIGDSTEDSFTSVIDKPTDNSSQTIDASISQWMELRVGKFSVGNANVSGFITDLEASIYPELQNYYAVNDDSNYDPEEFVPNRVGEGYIVGEFSVGFDRDWFKLSINHSLEQIVPATTDTVSLDSTGEASSSIADLGGLRFDWGSLIDLENLTVYVGPSLTVGDFFVVPTIISTSDNHTVVDTIQSYKVDEFIVGTISVDSSRVVQVLQGPWENHALGLSHLGTVDHGISVYGSYYTDPEATVGRFTVGPTLTVGELVVNQFEVGEGITAYVLDVEKQYVTSDFIWETHESLVDTTVSQDAFDVGLSYATINGFHKIVGEFNVGDTIIYDYGSILASHTEQIAHQDSYEIDVIDGIDHAALIKHVVGPHLIVGAFTLTFDGTHIVQITVEHISEPIDVQSELNSPILDSSVLSSFRTLDSTRFDFSVIEPFIGPPLVGAFSTGTDEIVGTSFEYASDGHTLGIKFTPIINEFMVGSDVVGDQQHIALYGPNAQDLVGISHLRDTVQEISVTGTYSTNPELIVGHFNVTATEVGGSLTVNEFTIGDAEHHVLSGADFWSTSSLDANLTIEPWLTGVYSDDYSIILTDVAFTADIGSTIPIIDDFTEPEQEIGFNNYLTYPMTDYFAAYEENGDPIYTGYLFDFSLETQINTVDSLGTSQAEQLSDIIDISDSSTNETVSSIVDAYHFGMSDKLEFFDYVPWRVSVSTTVGEFCVGFGPDMVFKSVNDGSLVGDFIIGCYLSEDEVTYTDFEENIVTGISLSINQTFSKTNGWSQIVGDFEVGTQPIFGFGDNTHFNTSISLLSSLERHEILVGDLPVNQFMIGNDTDWVSVTSNNYIEDVVIHSDGFSLTETLLIPDVYTSSPIPMENPGIAPELGSWFVYEQTEAVNEQFRLDAPLIVGGFAVSAYNVGDITVGGFIVGSSDHHVIGTENDIYTITNLEQSTELSTLINTSTDFSHTAENIEVLSYIRPHVGVFTVGPNTVVNDFGSTISIDEEIGDSKFENAYDPVSIIGNELLVGKFHVSPDKMDWFREPSTITSVDDIYDGVTDVCDQRWQEANIINQYDLHERGFNLDLVPDKFIESVPHLVGGFNVGAISVGDRYNRIYTSDKHYQAPSIKELTVGMFDVGIALIGDHWVESTIHGPNSIGVSHINMPTQEIVINEPFSSNPLRIGTFIIGEQLVDPTREVGQFIVGAGHYYVDADTNWLSDISSAIVETYDVGGTLLSTDYLNLSFREYSLDQHIFNWENATNDWADQVEVQDSLDGSMLVIHSISDDWLSLMPAIGTDLLSIGDIEASLQTRVDVTDRLLIDEDGRTTTIQGIDSTVVEETLDRFEDTALIGDTIELSETQEFNTHTTPNIGTFIVGDGSIVRGFASVLEMDFQYSDLHFQDKFLLDVFVGDAIIVGSFEVQPINNDFISNTSSIGLTDSIEETDYLGKTLGLDLTDTFNPSLSVPEFQAIDNLYEVQRTYQVNEFTVGSETLVGQEIRVDSYTSDKHYIKSLYEGLIIGDFSVSESRFVNETWEMEYVTGSVGVAGVSHLTNSYTSTMSSIYTNDSIPVVGAFIVDSVKVGVLIVNEFIIGDAPFYVAIDKPDKSDFSGAIIEEYDEGDVLISTEYRNLRLRLAA